MTVQPIESRSVIVKICGITRAADALAAVEAGATAIGFNFYPASPRYIAPEAAAEIAARLPAHIWKAGIFVDETSDAIERVGRRVPLDIVQLYGAGAGAGFRVWRARRMDADFSPGAIERDTAEAVLLDTLCGSRLGGTGQTFDWSRARGVRKNIVIAGGLDASNVRDAIRTARPWGVDASSRLEVSPGVKDREKIRQFVAAALAEVL
ncbi:MAG: phosphoribosylanthranilate isomerase [Bryobacteraceae bacterium]